VLPETGRIDFEGLREKAKLFRPQMILCGASAYPRVMEWDKFREIADEVWWPRAKREARCFLCGSIVD